MDVLPLRLKQLLGKNPLLSRCQSHLNLILSQLKCPKVAHERNTKVMKMAFLRFLLIVLIFQMQHYATFFADMDQLDPDGQEHDQLDGDGAAVSRRPATGHATGRPDFTGIRPVPDRRNCAGRLQDDVLQHHGRVRAPVLNPEGHGRRESSRTDQGLLAHHWMGQRDPLGQHGLLQGNNTELPNGQ